MLMPASDWYASKPAAWLLTKDTLGTGVRDAEEKQPEISSSTVCDPKGCGSLQPPSPSGPLLEVPGTEPLDRE